MQKRLENYYIHELDTFLKLPRKVQESMWLDLKGRQVEPELFDVAYDFDTYEQCESPIEIIFAYHWDKYYLENKISVDTLTICPQETITTNDGKVYRADFLIYYSEVREIAPDNLVEFTSEVIVECDGHNFHEKTKAQVKKRNDRDYDLKMSGYDVIHFSGSEIYNNPDECVKKVVEYLKKNAKPTSE